MVHGTLLKLGFNATGLRLFLCFKAKRSRNKERGQSSRYPPVTKLWTPTMSGPCRRWPERPCLSHVDFAFFKLFAIVGCSAGLAGPIGPDQ